MPPLHPGEPGEGCGEGQDPTPEDDELDEVGFRAPLPPEDRVWRHPSELAAMARPAASPSTGRRRGVLAVGGIAAGVLLVASGARLLDADARPDPDRPAPTTPAAPVVADAGTVPDRPAWMGLHGSDAAATPAGALVDRVAPGGPADRAGLRPGDVVTGVDGAPLASMLELVRLLRRHAPGDVVVLAVHRADATHEVRIRLEPWPDEPG